MDCEFNQLNRGFTSLLIVIIVCTSCAPAEPAPSTPDSTEPAPVISESFDSHIVLVYGPGASSTMYGGSVFGELLIPELAVYENGLVLFSCYEDTAICQHKVKPERVTELLDEFSALGFFDDTWYNYDKPVRLGPSTAYFMIVSNPTDKSQTSKMYWTTKSYEGNLSQAPGLLGPALTLAHQFKAKASPGKIYQPQYAALWITVDECAGDQASRPWCEDLESIPAWPFDFDPSTQIDDDSGCSRLEVPQTISDIEAAIPDFDDSLSGERYRFRYGSDLVSVRVRPYLPGEEMPTGCMSRWSNMHPNYDTLPFYSEETPESTP